MATSASVEKVESDLLLNIKYWKSLKLFRDGVQLGKHRAFLRQYENCFVASEVITWFHSEVGKKLESGFTRKDSLNLLQEFYRAGVFTEVTNQQSANEIKSSVIKETDFKDNRRLFRFVEEEIDDSSESDNNEKSIPTKTPRDKDCRPASEYNVVIKPLPEEEIYKIWEETFIKRFCEVIGEDVFTSFLQPGTINGSWILHNMSKLSVNGIVLIDPIDELPSWVMNAMRSLTRCQTNNLQNENVLPTYDGFEVDVFNVVRDHFSTLKDVAPLVTFDLYDAFVSTFIRANKVPLRVPELLTTSIYRRSQSATNLSDSNHDRCPNAPPLRKTQTVANLRGSLFVTSPSKSARETMEKLSGFTANHPTLMTSEGKAYAITSFRLLSLLLPPKNRRYLQILLQFMAKTSQIEKLITIDVGNTNRAMVINEFCSSIIGCLVKKEYDEFLGKQIVTLLMDNIGEIFDVRKEEKLKKEAEELISEQQIAKAPLETSSQEEKEIGLCARISLDEFEDQRLLGATAQSLRDLLDTIVASKNCKERTKQIKQFRNEYPHIYYERFGDPDNPESVDPCGEKEKEKKPRGNKLFHSFF